MNLRNRMVLRGRFMQAVKRTILRIAKLAGLFSVAQYYTRAGVRILCYHGFNLVDEGEFRPAMFMRPELFEKRLQFLKERQFTILTLSEMEAALEKGALPTCATVITIDDGWYSTYAEALPRLRSRNVRPTLYVTTYHMDNQKPVFGICVSYLFWKSPRSAANLSTLGVPGLANCDKVNIEDAVAANNAMKSIIDFGENHCQQAQRDELLSDLAIALDVAFDAITDSRLLHLVNRDELAEMRDNGWDIQLHTHRHRLPEDYLGAKKEIDDNRESLHQIIEGPLTHFCYPSGEWSEAHLDILPRIGVSSATTCDPGLAYPSSAHKLALPRITDTSFMSDIEFEAEMSGLSDVLRKCLSALLKRDRSTPYAARQTL